MPQHALMNAEIRQTFQCWVVLSLNPDSQRAGTLGNHGNGDDAVKHGLLGVPKTIVR